MISKFFIYRPKFAFVISIIIVIAGLIALENLPIAQYPQITPPEVSISTNYPGASAKTVEQTVIDPIEQQVNGVEDMIYFTSESSSNGSANITVSFEVGTDPNMNTVNTQNRVSIATAQLPDEVMKEGVTVKQQSSDLLLVVALYSEEGNYDEIYLNNYAYINLIDPIARVPGVGQAQLFGEEQYAMRVWLNPNKLTSLGISTGEVIDAVMQQNTQVAAGQIGQAPVPKGQQYQFTIQTQGRLASVKEFENIIIREDPSGAMVKIKDVGSVELGAQSYSAFSLVNNKPAALIGVYQLPGANALQVADGVNKVIEDYKVSFPKGIKAASLYDTTLFVKASVQEVVSTLFIAVILVIVVTFVFLQNWRSALIPTIAIPVSLIGTFAVLLALGYSINLITLFGLILAIGIVVDDAIVVIENVSRIMEEEGLPPREAAVKSMEQVSAPIIATTLVLMATFVPVAFLPGITGQLYRQFSVTIAISVLISAVNALTLSPALCATLLKPESKKVWLPFRLFNKFFGGLTKGYTKSVSFLIRKTAIIVIVFLLILGAIYVVYGDLPTGFIPSEDQGAFMVNIQLPPGASLERTSEVLEKAYNILAETKGVKDILSVSGFSIITGTCSANMGLIIVTLDDWSKRTAPGLHVDAILAKVNEEFYAIPEASISAFNLPPIPGLGTGGGFQFELQQKGEGSAQALQTITNEILYYANQSPELTEVFSTYTANTPQIYLDINREKAMKMGINLNDLFSVLQTYLGSIYVNEFNKFGKVFQVLLQAEENFRNEVVDINRLYVKNKFNEMVPLNTLMSISTILGPDVISHYNMLTSVNIQGSSSPGHSSGDAIKKMEQLAKEILPPDMTYSWTGTAYQEILAGNLVAIILALAITFIYLFLVAQYESWLISFAVILSIPVAFLGSLFALFVTGIANDIYAQIGFTLIFGMAAKTAILIVEFAKDRREEGKPILESAEFAAHIRFRAVIMTGISFILGVFPLVIATGASAASRRSLGTAVFGGMIVAAILGTLLIPGFYVIMQKLIEYKKKKN